MSADGSGPVHGPQGVDPGRIVTPKKTVYVGNLNHKLSLNGLRRELYACFSRFGAVIEVISIRSDRLRGQAWIVFRDLSSAVNAIRKLQGFSFYGRPMRLGFALEEGHILAKLDGSFEVLERERKRKLAREDREKQSLRRDEDIPVDEEMDEESLPPEPKKAKVAAPYGDKGTRTEVGTDPPSRVLFARGLPESFGQAAVEQVFRTLPGFEGVRLVPGSPGIAFVDFEEISDAKGALFALNEYRLSESNTLVLSFAKADDK